VKNKHGMTRSKEFMKTHGAESETSHEKNETPAEKKSEEKSTELHHMRVHPADEHGTVKVTHHAGPVAAPHATHAFEEKEGEELVNHLMEHSGMAYGSEGGGEHYADEKEEVEA